MPTDPKKPYKVIQRGDAVSIAQAGLLGEGLPNHRTRVSGAARSARARARPGQVRRQARSDRRERRPDRADAHVPSRQLRHRRDVRGEERDRPAADAVRVLPADARHQDRAAAELVDAGRVHRTGRLQRGRQVQEGRLRRDRQARHRPEAQAAVHDQGRQRLGRDDRALFRQRVAAAERLEGRARVLRAQARRTASTRPGSSCRWRRSRPARPERRRCGCTRGRRNRT